MLFSSLEFRVLFLPLTLGPLPQVGLAAATALSLLLMNYGSKFLYFQF